MAGLAVGSDPVRPSIGLQNLHFDKLANRLVQTAYGSLFKKNSRKPSLILDSHSKNLILSIWPKIKRWWVRFLYKRVQVGAQKELTVVKAYNPQGRFALENCVTCSTERIKGFMNKKGKIVVSFVLTPNWNATCSPFSVGRRHKARRWWQARDSLPSPGVAIRTSTGSSYLMW